MPSVDVILRTATERLAPLDEAAGRAWWDASTAATDEHEAARVAADLALGEALGDADLYAAVLAADAAGDPMADRQLTVLRNRMATSQIDPTLREQIVRLAAAVDGRFNRHRAVVDGVETDDNGLAEILRTSDDPAARRGAWEAAKTIGPAVADDVRRLAHLRNQAARDLGARDYFALTLATQELDEERLVATLDAVDDATRDHFQGWKAFEDRRRATRFATNVSELAPWHYDDAFFQAAPAVPGLDVDGWLRDLDQEALTRATYAGLGIDIDHLLARSDLRPRAGKSQHAFCIDIDRAGDIRVLCNNVPGEYWTETMLHEFGHAIYDAGVDPTLPWLTRTMHPLTTEGVAMLFGRLTRDPEWLVAVAGVDPDVVRAAAPLLAQHRLTNLLVFARWVLVMTNFERTLYADPDQDLDACWWDLVARHQDLRRPAGRHEADWATKIHVALAPVYYQNYLLGELVASQLQASLHDRVGGIVGRPGAGDLLRSEVFAPGWSVPWATLVRQATGAPLSVAPFAREIETLATVAGR